MREPSVGEMVVSKIGMTGRYIGDGLVLTVCAQDNEPMVTEISTEQPIPEPHLKAVLPSMWATEAAAEVRAFYVAARNARGAKQKSTVTTE